VVANEDELVYGKVSVGINSTKEGQEMGFQRLGGFVNDGSAEMA
jgi:hypothetical protein